MPEVVFRSDEIKAVELAQSVAALLGPMFTRVISQERERCAKIAEKLAEANLNFNSDADEATAASSVAQSIANLIRVHGQTAND